MCVFRWNTQNPCILFPFTTDYQNKNQTTYDQLMYNITFLSNDRNNE